MKKKLDINTLHLKSNFSISRMEDIYEHRKEKTNTPHRHNYFTILIIEKAKGEHIIDFNSYPLGVKQIFFIAPGQVHTVIEKEKSQGFVITFSNEFLIENSIETSFLDRLNLFNNYGENPPLMPNNETFIKIIGYNKHILRLFNSEEPYKIYAIGAYLKLLLIDCNTICMLHPLENKGLSKEDMLVKNFKKLVELHFKTEHFTSFYARKLSINPDYLNRKIISKIGITAKEYIQTRITTEAKRLMFFSDKNLKEIGYTLGFNEPSHFSSFFKNCIGMSPTAFKKNIK